MLASKIETIAAKAPPAGIPRPRREPRIASGVKMKALWADYQAKRDRWMALGEPDARNKAWKDLCAATDKIIDARTTSPEGLLAKLEILAEIEDVESRLDGTPKDMMARIVLSAIRDLREATGTTEARQ